MTFLEAIHSIEKRLEKLKLKYPDGTLMEGVVAMGEIGHFHQKRYDDLIDDLEHGRCTVDEYYLGMMKMIFEFEEQRRKMFHVEHSENWN